MHAVLPDEHANVDGEGACCCCAQVRYHAAQQFSRAAMQEAAQRGSGASASDRAYQVSL